MADKQDSFTPRRATSTDGFLSGSGQQPRRPAFRGNGGPTIQPSPENRRPEIGKTFDGTPIRPNLHAVATQDFDNRDVRNNTQSDGYLAPPSQHGLAEPRRRSSKLPSAKSKRGFFSRRRQDTEEGDYASPKRKKKHKIRRAFVILMGLAVLFFGLRFYGSISKLTGNNNPLNVLGALRDAPLKNDNGRVNILVAGNSADEIGHNGAELTDSIMIVSVDTKENTAMMLSVPRDMWVRTPSGGHSKINAVYPESGMPGLASVLEDNLGLPIHYNTLVSYNAFRDLVNAVGGIKITIKSIDPRGIYDPNLDYTSSRCCALAKYPNGPVDLNGKQALNLARARGDGGGYGFPQGDFDRTEHQRQMLIAIKQKVSSASVIANPMKVSNLVSAVGDNVKTDLSLAEMQTLFKVMKRIDDSKIDSYNVNTLKGGGSTMLASYSAPGGQSALIPAAGLDDYTEIAAQIKRTFTSSPVAKEAADIVVLNGTDLPGLAKLESNKLDAQGTNTLLRANGSPHTKTVIIDNSGGSKPNTIAFLKSRYKTVVSLDAQVSKGYPAADIIVILGNDAAVKYQNPGGSATSQN